MKDSQVVIDVPQETQAILETAAQLCGQDVASFVLESAERKSIEVIGQHRRIALSKEQHYALHDALMSPAKPTPGLKELMAETPLRRR